MNYKFTYIVICSLLGIQGCTFPVTHDTRTDKIYEDYQSVNSKQPIRSYEFVDLCPWFHDEPIKIGTRRIQTFQNTDEKLIESLVNRANKPKNATRPKNCINPPRYEPTYITYEYYHPVGTEFSIQTIETWWDFENGNRIRYEGTINNNTKNVPFYTKASKSPDVNIKEYLDEYFTICNKSP